MYITNEDYINLSLDSGISAGNFKKYYNRAELIFDDWTHKRCPKEWKNDEEEAPIWVKESIIIIMDSLNSLFSRDDVITSYHNGKETFHFGASSISSSNAIKSVYDYVKTIAPIEYISACVYY